MKQTVSLALRAALVAAVVVAVTAGSASAHAVLVSSKPKDRSVLKASPKEVILRFASRIEKRVVRVTLTEGRGRRVPVPVPRGGHAAGPPNQVTIPLPLLKPGAYRLQYQVLATDGHLTPGLVRFTISGGKSP